MESIASNPETLVRTFIPGLTLGKMIFSESARAIIETVVPWDGYAAAFMGYGSDVLGYDTERSMDHNWGPRFQLFLSEGLYAAKAEALDGALRRGLPHVFHGFVVRFSDPDPLSTDEGPVNHLIEITTVRGYLRRYLGADFRGAVDELDWLTFPEQRLLELTSGEVFHDPLGELTRRRHDLAYYPHDVWLYKMACQWQKLFQQESFVGRCAEVQDAAGMRLVAARVIRDIMKLFFLQERRYAPYEKWVGSAFAALPCAADATPLILAALEGSDYESIEQNLAELYQMLGEMHNSLGVTDGLDTSPRDFFLRPYTVIRAERFTNALLSAIQSERIRALSVRFGAIDQYIDNTDFIENVGMYRKVRALYL
jgi:hypothetical protein